MKKNKNKKNPYDVSDCRLLGKGNNGEVYELPNGKVIKICFKTKDFKGEYKILQRVKGNKYFPRIYEVGSNYMVRECVHGEGLYDYINKNGINKLLGHNLIEMLKEFKKLKFKKIDLRCRDILVQYDESIKVIDPKGFYSKSRSFPQHLSKGLYSLGKLDSFLEILNEEEPKLYKQWAPQIDNYIKDRNKTKA